MYGGTAMDGLLLSLDVILRLMEVRLAPRCDAALLAGVPPFQGSLRAALARFLRSGLKASR